MNAEWKARFGMAEKKQKEKVSGAKAIFWDYGKAIFWAVLIALIVRSFVIQPFHIPSGSMIPTFLEGDHVLVEKFAYGIRNPITNKVLLETGRPERGDVVIFLYPEDAKTDFVKRVIGLPGETVALRNGILYINGLPTPDPHANYDRQFNDDLEKRNFGPLLVPENSYFMMGDNRDYSNDSRYWTSVKTVDFELIRGKAWRLYWSWDSETSGLGFLDRLRGDRLGRKIE